MADLIAFALSQAEALTAAACRAAVQEGLLSKEGPAPRAEWGGPFGDCSTAYPLAAAKAFGRPPEEIAGLLAGKMALEGSCFSSVEAAGPGFLNFRLSDCWYEAALSAIEGERARYGCSDTLAAGRAAVSTASLPPAPSLDALRAEMVGDALAGVLAAGGKAVRRHPGRDGGCLPPGTVLIETAGQGRTEARWLPVKPARLLRDGAPAGTGLSAVPESVLRFFLSDRPSVPVDLSLRRALRQDRGNPAYSLCYACRRLRRLPAAEGPVKEFPFSPEERALIKAAALYPAALRQAGEYLDPGRVSRCLLALLEALRACRAASRAGAAPCQPRCLAAAGQVLENGLRVLQMR